MKIKFNPTTRLTRTLLKLTISLALIISLIPFSIYNYANPGIGIYVDNQPLKMDVPPLIIKGRTMVPISALGNALNCKTSWNEKNQNVIIRSNKSIVRLSINSKVGYIDDNLVTLDYPPTIISSRTMVPLSFVAKALNYDIKWDPVHMNVHVKTETRTMIASESNKLYDELAVIDAITLRMNINGEMKTVKLDGVNCATEQNSLLNGGSACIAGKVSDPQLEKIRDILASGDVSTKVISTLDKDTVSAEIYVDGTSLSQLLIELGYVVEIN